MDSPYNLPPVSKQTPPRYYRPPMNYIGSGEGSHLLSSHRILIGHGSRNKIYFINSKDKTLHIVIKAIDAHHPVLRYQLIQEFQSLSQLDHPYIARVFGLIERFETSELMLFMEGTRLGAISNLIFKKSPIMIYYSSSRIKILRQVLIALRYLHSQGIAHRDIKPENVIRMIDGNIRIIDFDRSVYFNEIRQLEISRDPGCYVNNMAFDQYYETPAGPHCDFWSFGVLIYEVFSGKRMPVFDPLDELSIQPMIEAARAEFLSKGKDEIYQVIKFCLNPDPGKRLMDYEYPALVRILQPYVDPCYLGVGERDSWNYECGYGCCVGGSSTEMWGYSEELFWNQVVTSPEAADFYDRK